MKSTALFCWTVVVLFSALSLTAQGQDSRTYKQSGIPVSVRDFVAPPDQTLALWPTTPPGGIPEDLKEEDWRIGDERNPVIRVGNVGVPTLGIYKATKPNGTAVVIFPGGGYSILSYNHEGTEIASWLNDLGITAVVVKYRVPRRRGQAKHLAPLQDAQRAIRIVRHLANQLGIVEDKIGVLGFSAGGHLAIMAATQFGTKTYEPVDTIDQISCRPNFAIPIYPAYMMDDEKEKKASVALSEEVVISSDVPPMFISVADKDMNRAAASARLYIKLFEANVPCELHVINGGAHGYGLRKDRGRFAHWDLPCERWLQELGFLQKSK